MNGIDDGKLDTVIKFANFIELLQDPKSMAQVLADAKQTSAKLKEQLGARDTVVAAKAYSDKVDKDVADKYKALEAREADINTQLTTLTKNQGEFSKKSTTKQQELETRESVVVSKEAAVASKEIALNKLQNELQVRSSVLDARDKVLSEQEGLWKEKTAQIKSLVG